MQGVGVPLVTPFDSDGNIDEQKLRELTSWVIENGVDFIVPCGSNGESELMTVSERSQVIEIVNQVSTVPVVAGTGHPGLTETKQQTSQATASGVDAALIITPFYYTYGQDSIEEYFVNIADSSDIPVYLYSVPVKTGLKLATETIESLSTHSNIHGIKDSSGDVVLLQQAIDGSSGEFHYLIGNGSLFATGLEAGVEGGILALTNVVPELVSEIYRYYQGGDRKEAQRLNRHLIELNQAITSKYGIPGVKAAMKARGKPAGQTRSPLPTLSTQSEREIQKLVQEAIRQK